MTTTSAALGASPQEPIRCHVEWSSEGVRLWIGIDAVLADQLPALIPATVLELRRQALARGSRVLGVYCNGREVEAPDLGGEQVGKPGLVGP